MKTKPAKEILEKHIENLFGVKVVEYDNALKAMEEYGNQFKPKRKNNSSKLKEELSMYGVPMHRTCHKGKECGISGLSCQSPSCPHT